MARPQESARRPVPAGKAPKLAPANQAPQPEPRPKKKVKTKTRARKREPDSDNDEPAPPPKRARKAKKAGAKREPIVISEDEYEPALSRKTTARKVAKAGFPVGPEDEDENTVEALEARREPFTLRLFYPETVSRQRHAKRIFGVRSIGDNIQKSSSEDRK